jgi:hypothetical protein
MLLLQPAVVVSGILATQLRGFAVFFYIASEKCCKNASEWPCAFLNI